MDCKKHAKERMVKMMMKVTPLKNRTGIYRRTDRCFRVRAFYLFSRFMATIFFVDKREKKAQLFSFFAAGARE